MLEFGCRRDVHMPETGWRVGDVPVLANGGGVALKHALGRVRKLVKLGYRPVRPASV